MLIFTTIAVLCLFESSLANDCDRHVYRDCHQNGEPLLIPETVEKMDQFCNNAIPFYQCLIKKSENCSHHRAHKYLHNALPLVTEICQRNSTLYEAIVSGLPCFHASEREIFKPRMINESNTNKFRSFLADKGLVALSQVNETCLRSLLVTSHWSMQFHDSCKNSSQEAFEEILTRLKAPFRGCDNNVIKKYSTVVRAMQSTNATATRKP